MLRFASASLLPCLLLAGCQSLPIASGGSGGAVEFHYSPAENLEALDRATFLSARRSIDLCAYSLTDHALTEALTAAAQHGVKVRIYLDRSQTDGEISREEKKGRGSDGEEDPTDAGALAQLAATPNIELRVKHSKTLMHLKSYVVDGQLLRSGSANFSPTGEKRQDNDLSFQHDPALVQGFETNFEHLWDRTDNDPLPATH
jgi:phosphatidylserine/phosphatidylglycerophosphate/cardiolipin synthase-like enzyme